MFYQIYKNVGLPLLKRRRLQNCYTKNLVIFPAISQLYNSTFHSPLLYRIGVQDKQNNTKNLRWRKCFCCSGSNDHKIVIVTYEEVKDLINHPKKMLIDVREPDEVKETGKIPTSINIALGSICEELAATVKTKDFNIKYGREKPMKNTELIFYCRSGKRSLKAAQLATSLGFTDVKSYEGSWNEWAECEGLQK